MRKIAKISIFLLLSVLCIFVSSCDKHEHTYADGWSHDDTNHWHAATCEHKDEKKDEAAHVYDQKVVKNDYLCAAATEASAATYYYSCVCGVKGTETFSEGSPLSHVHTFDETVWKHDATNHWHAATCEHENEKKDEAAHIYDQKVVTKDNLCSVATEAAAATYYYSCVCGVKGTETFSDGNPLPHVHQYNQKVATKDNLCSVATVQAAATYYYSCVCGAKGTETFSHGEPLHEHTYDETVWIHDATNHWHAATCGHTNEKKDETAHKYDQQVVTKDTLCAEATVEAAATYYYSCVCGVKGTETFSYGEPLHVHTCDETVWEHDVIYHWHLATCEEHVGEKCFEDTHSYNKKVVADEFLCAAATESSAATYYYSCVCGLKGITTFSDGDPLPHNHTFDQQVLSSAYIVEAVEGATTATYYYSCACGEAGTETFVHTHTYEDTVVAPTCTEGGYTEHTCSECYASYQSDTTTATGHLKIILVERVEPTTILQGVAAHYECAACHELFEDEAGTKTITAEQLVIPLTTANLVESVSTYQWISPTAELDLKNLKYITAEKTSVIVISNASGFQDTLSIECTIEEVAYTLSMTNGALVLKHAEEIVDTFYVSAPEFNGAWLGPNNPNYYIISTKFNSKGYFDYQWIETATGEVITYYDDYYLTKLIFDELGNSYVQFYSDYDCIYYFNADDVLVCSTYWGDDLMTPFTQEMAGLMVGENGEYISYDYETKTVSYSDRDIALVEGIAATETHSAIGSGLAFTVGEKQYQLVDCISHLELVNLQDLSRSKLCGYSPDFLVDGWANSDLSKSFTINEQGELVLDNVAYKVIPYCLDGELHFTIEADFAFDISLVVTEYGLELDVINVTTENENKEKVTEQYYYLPTLEDFIGSYDNYIDTITIDENYNISIYGSAPDAGSFCYNEDLLSVAYQYNNMVLAFLDKNVLAIFIYNEETQKLQFYGSVFNINVLPEILESFKVGLDSETDIYTTGGINPHTITKIDTEKHTIVYDDVEYGILIDYNITGYSPYPELYLYDLETEMIYYIVRTFDKGLELEIYDAETDTSTYQYFISNEFYQKNVLNIEYAYKGQYYYEHFKIDEMGKFYLDTTDYENETGLISPIIYDYGIDRYTDTNHGESFVIMANVGTFNLYVYVYLEENTGMIMGMEYSNMTILNYIGDYYLDNQKISLDAGGSVSIDGVAQTVVATKVVENGICIQIQKDTATQDLLFTTNTLTYQEKTYQKKEFNHLAFVGDYTFGKDKIEITSKCLSVNNVPELSVSINGFPAMYELKIVDGNQCLVLNSFMFNYDIYLMGSKVVFLYKDKSFSEGFDANPYLYSDFAAEDTILTDSNSDVHIVKTYAKEQLGVLGVTYDGEACNNYHVFVNDDGHYVLELTSGDTNIWLTITETGVEVSYKVSSIPLPPPLPPAPPLPPIL